MDYYESLWLSDLADPDILAAIFSWYCDEIFPPVEKRNFWFFESLDSELQQLIFSNEDISRKRIINFLTEYSGGIIMTCWWWLDNVNLEREEMALFLRISWFAENYWKFANLAVPIDSFKSEQPPWQNSINGVPLPRSIKI